ncbi:hypothetical protein GUJ93_ZPchr0012g20687 [Zizania palustris]|uniref:Uncharacterized protein n=1 Tax=Zizania palustris TaxID=103762 RepID=A0A8J6BSY7_ZIZPA|nr:hypothetical protein GUJ93_ZPchr0012g20687 [Zizania palustris]
MSSLERSWPAGGGGHTCWHWPGAVATRRWEQRRGWRGGAAGQAWRPAGRGSDVVGASTLRGGGVLVAVGWDLAASLGACTRVLFDMLVGSGLWESKAQL